MLVLLGNRQSRQRRASHGARLSNFCLPTPEEDTFTLLSKLACGKVCKTVVITVA